MEWALVAITLVAGLSGAAIVLAVIVLVFLTFTGR